jgi:hypothetical protein
VQARVPVQAPQAARVQQAELQPALPVLQPPQRQS